MESAYADLKRCEFLDLELRFLVPFFDVVVGIVLVSISDIDTLIKSEQKPDKH